MTTSAMGQEGTVFFVGVVEDIQDPEKLGRVRVRVYKMHSQNKALLPTDHLPWAPVMMPVTSSSAAMIGRSPTGLRVGSTVVGFFLDGNEAQIPMILGSLHGKPEGTHDVALLARGTNDIDKSLVGPEPASPFAAKYPYNHVWTTESGHKIEVDDTPTAERIQVWHKSGTYTEINAEGRHVTKIVNDGIEVIVGNKSVHVEGSGNVFVKGNLTVLVQGNADVTVNGNVTAQVDGNLTTTVGGAASITSDGAMTLRSNSTMSISAAGTLTISGKPISATADGALTLRGSTINLN